MFYMDLSGTVSPVWVPEIAIDGWTCSVASGWTDIDLTSRCRWNDVNCQGELL